MIEALLQSQSYDAVVCRYLSSGVHTGILLMDVRKIVDIDDLDTQVFEDRLALPGIAWWQRLLFRMQLWQLRRLVTAWAREASHLWLSCAQDLPSVMGQSTSLLPNIPFQAAASEPEFPLVKPTVPVVLIVGTLNHPPNVRGMDYFIEQVWPGVLERFPETQLRIVGGKLRDAERRRWMKARNVCVVGFVDSLAGEYRAATVVAVPILEGGGTKIKVLEALQYGCATVVTQHSLRGYADHLRPGESLVLATDAEEFVAAVSTLLRDKELRERLGQSGRAAVEKNYSRALVYAEIERVLRGDA